MFVILAAIYAQVAIKRALRVVVFRIAQNTSDTACIFSCKQGMRQRVAVRGGIFVAGIVVGGVVCVGEVVAWTMDWVVVQNLPTIRSKTNVGRWRCDTAAHNQNSDAIHASATAFRTEQCKKQPFVKNA